jgi:YfiR/HmsC-like
MALLAPVLSTPVGLGQRIERGLRLLPLLLLLALAPGAAAQTTVAREYQVKAVFLYNFALFVDWPPAAFEGSQAPLVIGILGADPFGNYLDEAVQNERVNNRPMVVRRFRRVEDVTTCHILFISPSTPDQLEHILSVLKGQSILTVSDAEKFCQLGGMIRFIDDKNKIRLRINIEAAKAAGLRISSKLLRPAEVVLLRKARK